MKRTGYLWDRFISYENFEEALKNVSKGKANRRCVKRVLANPRAYYELILANPFDVGHYTPKQVIDESSMKKRDILVPRFFPDQIVHHMLIQVIYESLMRGQYEKSCASIKGRGQLYASFNVRHYIKKNRRRKIYWAKLDIRHFYPSIDHDVLKAKLAKKIKDRDILALCGAIIDSCNDGIPIGNFTSQIFSNFYLGEFDHYVKEVLGVSFYCRYMDDMVLISPNRRKLGKEIDGIKNRLHHEYKVETHDDEVIYELNEYHPIDFVGYRHYSDHTTIRRRVFKHARRMSLRIFRNGNFEKIVVRQRRRIASYLGYVKYSSSVSITRKYQLYKEALRANAKQILL
jgi:RNA-directed DNA polymerase